MQQRINVSSMLLTLLALAIMYGLGATFFTIELERLIETTITPHIIESPGVASLNREIYSGIDQFMTSNHVRLIGYICVVCMISLAVIGLLAQKKTLASIGSIGFILPIYAYFMLHMSFLAGLGILTALWTPFWGNLVKLGDIAYLPYMVLVYPFSLLGIDLRTFSAGFFASLGLFIFILGVLAWFYAKHQHKKTADFWIYRFTRHPQYLGWIIWSYGLMLRVGHRQDTAIQNTNLGASLPWVISTLVIICVAFSEELRMRQQQGNEYNEYSIQAPFMLPLPRIVSDIIAAPFRFILRKDKPDSRWDLVWIFIIYLGFIIILSLPFVLFPWPPSGWANWPV